MQNKTEIRKNGNYFLFRSEELSTVAKREIENFCSEKILTGESGDTGIVICSEYEILYLTLNEIRNGFFSQVPKSQCNYQLEF